MQSKVLSNLVIWQFSENTGNKVGKTIRVTTRILESYARVDEYTTTRVSIWRVLR